MCIEQVTKKPSYEELEQQVRSLAQPNIVSRNNGNQGMLV